MTNVTNHDVFNCEDDDCQDIDCLAYSEWCNEGPPTTDTCPEHGDQPITAHGQTQGWDPYATSILACGHEVTCLGPGEPNIILRGYPR